MNARRASARRWGFVAACALALWLAVPARAQEDLSGIPAYAGYVTDSAAVIGAQRSAQLESYLDQLQRKTGVQFAVLTVPSTHGEDPDQYKVRVFKAWGIGAKGRDDGLLLLVAMEEHRVVFETGYGLEGTLPDGWQSRMLRDLLVPRIRAGRTADGITVAVLATAKRIADEKGVTLEWTGDALTYDAPRSGPSRFELAFIAAWVILALIIVVLNATRGGGGRGGRRGGGGWGAYGPWIGGGGMGGGWGGGFGGGGGGGGGSFGGFGGGSSGGGGGGASW